MQNRMFFATFCYDFATFCNDFAGFCTDFATFCGLFATNFNVICLVLVSVELKTTKLQAGCW